MQRGRRRRSSATWTASGTPRRTRSAPTANDLAQFVAHAARGSSAASPRPQDVDHLLIRGFLAQLHRAGPARRPRPRASSPACAPSSATCAARACSTRTPRGRSCRRASSGGSPPTCEEARGRRRSSTCRATGSPPCARRAILELLYATGIRCAELVGLDLGEVDLEARMVRVLGKGRKERIVPFGSRARDAVRACLPVRTRMRPRHRRPVRERKRGSIDRSERTASWSLDG